MGRLDEWGTALVEEGLREAADTFFGTRKALDDEIDVFKARVARLADKALGIHSWFAGLNCLLGSQENSRAFFGALGVSLVDQSLYAVRQCSLQFRRPRGFTRKSLYTKAVWEVYVALADLVHEYMHGTTYQDPKQPGRMLVSVHYTQLLRRCADLNEHIARVNESLRPSDSLGFARRMNLAERDRENITGGGHTWSLDQDLAFLPLDFTSFGLPSFPDLPTNAQAREVLRTFCAQIFSWNRGHIDQIIGEILGPQDKQICILERKE